MKLKSVKEMRESRGILQNFLKNKNSFKKYFLIIKN